MFTDPILDMEKQIRWFSAIEDNPHCKYWVIEYDETGIGLVCLNNIDFANDRCSWGHYIADVSFRGKGIGKILEYNIYDYVFLELGLNRLTVEVLNFNSRAIELHKKCGSQIEGVLRQHIKKGTEYHDVVIMGILRDEWLERRNNLSYEKIAIET